MTVSPSPWAAAGSRFTAYYARSWWRLALLLVAALVVIFAPLYAIRGVRLVQLGAVALIAATGAIVAFARPFESTLLAIFLGFSGLDAYVPGPVAAGLLALVLARTVADALDGRQVHAGTWGHRFALAVLLATALTSVAAALRIDHVLVEVRNIVLGLALYFTIAHTADRPWRLAVTMAVFAFAIAVASALPLRALAGGGGLSLVNIALAGRIGGLGSDPNIHAGDVNCVLPLLIAVLPRFHGWQRLGLAVLVPVLVASVIVSQSRAGVLLLALLSLVQVLRAGKAARRIALVGLIALAVVATLLPPEYWVRFESIAQFRGIVVDRSLLLRQHVGQLAWRVFGEHPWIGVGLGNFRDYAPRYMLGELKAHNSYLEVAANMGIAGLAAYAAWLATGLHMAWSAGRRWRERGRAGRADRILADGIILAIVAFGATALTLSIEFSLTLWTLLGLAAAALRCAQAPAA